MGPGVCRMGMRTWSPNPAKQKANKMSNSGLDCQIAFDELGIVREMCGLKITMYRSTFIVLICVSSGLPIVRCSSR